MKFLAIILLSLSISSVACAQSDFADEVSMSALTQTALPNGTLLVRDGNVPPEYKQLFKQFVAGNPQASQGKMELLVLNGGGHSRKSDAAKLRAQFENNLKNAGWIYEIHGEENGITFFTAIKKSPARKNIFGYWTPVDNSLMLAMTEVFYGKAGAPIDDNPAVSDKTEKQNFSKSAQIFNLSATEQNVNVMGDQMPPMPSFPALAKKKGKIRGYVKDLSGNFLKGAAIALGSTRIGYSRVVTETVTDAKGYYELDLPLNSGTFYYAAYALDYDSGRAAMTLHPADGDINDNPPIEGGVENFVLLPYGIANKASLAENSNYSSSFYGGAIALYIDMALPGADISFNRGRFNPGSKIEITLTPLGNLIDGSAPKTFVINKNLDENTRNEFFINNIPVGKYRLTVKSGGKAVGMRQRLPENSVYGIHPIEAKSEATLLFYPKSGNPREIGAGSGGWNQVEIYLETQDK